MRFKRIYVEITNKCNLNCSFCSKDNRELKELSLQEFDTILYKIRQYTNCIYLHVKGEPLLHRYFKEILDITEKHHMKVKITTNGTLLDKQYNTLQNAKNIIQINISLHSENKVENYFEKVFNVSEKLSSHISIVYRIWLQNNQQFDKLSTMIVDKIIEHYNLNDNFKDLVRQNKNIKIKDNIYLDKDSEFVWPKNQMESENSVGTCMGTRSHIAVLVNGDVVPCCLDSQANLKLGNLFENNLEDILKGELFVSINEGFKNHKLVCNLCKNCNYRMQKFK